MRAYPFLAFAASVLTACASPALPQVRSRAVDDLDCPEKLIRIQEELGGHFRADGCGRKVRYRTACEGLVCEVRNEDEPAIPWRDRPPPGN